MRRKLNPRKSFQGIKGGRCLQGGGLTVLSRNSSFKNTLSIKNGPSDFRKED